MPKSPGRLIGGAVIKILYNDSREGFCLSDGARWMYKESTGKRLDKTDPVDREDPVLIDIVEKLGAAASASYSSIKICQLPAIFSGFYEITQFEGLETVKYDVKEALIHVLHKTDVRQMTERECAIFLMEITQLAKLLDRGLDKL